MAMLIGSKAGSAAEMNVTPMIDILLVLIIIFMMIQGKSRGEQAMVPQPPEHNSPLPEPEGTVVLELHAAATGEADLALNHQPVLWPDLRQRLFDIYKSRAERVLFIKADEALEFAPVAEAMDVAHIAYPGIKVGLITEQIEQ